MKFLTITKTFKVGLAYIPEMTYDQFYDQALEYLKDPANIIVSYYGLRKKDQLNMFCAIANESTENMHIASYTVIDEPGLVLPSLSLYNLDAYYFEYDISQKLGVNFNFLKSREDITLKE